MSVSANESPAIRRLLRIPEVFAPFAGEILPRLGVAGSRMLGKDYHLADPAESGWSGDPAAAKFVRWWIPVEHAWPCRPQAMEQFIEKAAQGLFRKFGARAPQAVLCGPLQAGAAHPYYRHLAVNLRGRTLQLFPASGLGAEEQDPERPTLFCLVGKEGLFAGMATPREANGFYPGGTRFIRQSGEGTISRAGAKIAEALHYLRLHRPPLREGSHWLELGASPGGMTSELLDRGHRVTAVDRAPLDRRLAGREGLRFERVDAAEFLPRADERYDAILSDLNGDAGRSIRLLIRLAAWLRPGGLAFFTLKTPGASTPADIDRLFDEAVALAGKAGLALIARTHLTYNRQEFTLFFERS